MPDIETPDLPTRPVSISDDDLCARCHLCTYRPGEMSACDKNWPGKVVDEDYVQECTSFEPKF